MLASGEGLLCGQRTQKPFRSAPVSKRSHPQCIASSLSLRLCRSSKNAAVWVPAGDLISPTWPRFHADFPLHQTYLICEDYEVKH